MLSSFHLISERHGQTDIRTDGNTNGRTDGQTEMLYQYLSRVSVLTRDKNYPIFMKFFIQQQILNWMKVT